MPRSFTVESRLKQWASDVDMSYQEAHEFFSKRPSRITTELLGLDSVSNGYREVREFFSFKEPPSSFSSYIAETREKIQEYHDRRNVKRRDA